ncbi:MAG: helix-turn-helix transcriptional regulator [Thermoleophilia bacterium]|jgi:DNA-binding XRE family transcriptional regulator|nr:helix-turn-helix transcriptional regulator [Thermoleophilia bacterium]
MRKGKKTRLESGGWRVGDAAEFLELSPGEAAFVDVKLALAEHLRSLRHRCGWTQTEVAERIGSSQSRVARMEAADASVTLDLIVRSLLALGATVSEVGRVIGRAA